MESHLIFFVFKLVGHNNMLFSWAKPSSFLERPTKYQRKIYSDLSLTNLGKGPHCLHLFSMRYLSNNAFLYSSQFSFSMKVFISFIPSGKYYQRYRRDTVDSPFLFLPLFIIWKALLFSKHPFFYWILNHQVT